MTYLKFIHDNNIDCFLSSFFSQACSIELEDRVVVTGGNYDGTRVQMYNISGLVESLPDINTPRVDHACGQFLNSDGVIVSIQMHLKVDNMY